uniref:Right handed beta helix domain-containing protein n=1 Tax=Amphimedon queenslandica TaxID=400682 RepID=A0A1X7TR68_AMPQE
MILLLCILLHSVSSLNIRIDGDNGIDSIECLTEQPQSSCQSLKYVADTINNTGNLTIEIISPTLSLQGSVIFTDINGLTINGQGTSISCRNESIPYGNSGIVFDTCSNVTLISFTIEHCGLLYKNELKYYGRQSVLFYNCKNFNILKVNFSDNNGYGLVLYDSSDGSIQQNIFANNSVKQSDLSIAEKSNATGGGLHIIFQYNPHNNKIAINASQFINNSATTIGGALYMEVDHCANFNLYITTSNFIGNRAGTAGGAIGFIVHRGKCNYQGAIPYGFRISLISCNITNNMAKIGGGVTIQIVHYEAPGHIYINKREIFFQFCYFTGNKGMVSSAVDINGKIQKVDQSALETYVRFQYCYFIDNIAGIGIYQKEFRGKLFKATLYATDAIVFLVTKILFVNNTGTALYAVNTRVHMSSHAHINFSNNTGDQGGAIFFADGSTIDYDEHIPNGSSLINISNNKALIGGAIYIQSLINIHEGTCFISNYHNNVTFYFTKNNATSGFGHDIFASTLQECVSLYSENTTKLFKNEKMGKFKFSSWTPPPVATAPVKLSINEKELVPYPGIPYNMTITQMDELNSNITNLQLFPLSATLQNVQDNSSLKIDITYSIANNYIIVFKGTVGDTATLLLQTTEYSARKLINITLYHCPPGYKFKIDTCHCKSNYYYGISGRLEDDAAIIDGGLWAGYIGEKFATADC